MKVESLKSCTFYFHLGYDDKVKRILTKANLTPVKDTAELEALIEKTRAKIERPNLLDLAVELKKSQKV